MAPQHRGNGRRTIVSKIHHAAVGEPNPLVLDALIPGTPAAAAAVTVPATRDGTTGQRVIPGDHRESRVGLPPLTVASIRYRGAVGLRRGRMAVIHRTAGRPR